MDIKHCTLKNVGLKVNKRLRFWRVVLMDFHKSSHGELVDYGPMISFKNDRWSLIEVLGKTFEQLVIGGKTPYQIYQELKRIHFSEQDYLELSEFLEHPVTCITEDVFMEIVHTVRDFVGNDIYSLVPVSKHHVPRRTGYIVPHMLDMVLELGTPNMKLGSLCGNVCQHCYWSNIRQTFHTTFPDEIPEEHLLTTADYIRLVEWADLNNLYKVRLTGAPFGAWETTAALIKCCMEFGIELVIHSESTFMEEKHAQEIVTLAKKYNRELPSILISLEGSTPEINHIIRRSFVIADKEAFFNKIIDGIRTFSQYGFPVTISTCGHAQNYNDWWNMFELLKPIIDNWEEWMIYQPEFVGRLVDNDRRAATPKQLAQSSLAFISRWLKHGDRAHDPEISLPLCGPINPKGGIPSFQKLFMNDQEILKKGEQPFFGIDSITAFYRDRLSVYITPYGAIRCDGMEYIPRHNQYLYSHPKGVSGGSLLDIWKLSSFQKVKNIPLSQIPECRNCRIAQWCRGGFMADFIGKEGWRFEDLLKPDSKRCALSGQDTTGKVTAHFLKQAHKLLT